MVIRMNNETFQEIFENAKSDPTLLSTIDVDKLLDIIEGEDNHYLENKTLADVSKDIFDAIAELNIDTELAEYFCTRLAGYRHVERICDLKNGRQLCWIKRPTISNGIIINKKNLINGGLLVNVKIDDSGVKLLCRAGVKLFFNIKFDDCLIFQKLSMEEQLVIMSYDYIENETIL